MEYTVYNGCMAIAIYKQKAAAIRRAKKVELMNLIDETVTEVTIIARYYSTDPNGIEIYNSLNQE